jgi:hypothetical protein
MELTNGVLLLMDRDTMDCTMQPHNIHWQTPRSQQGLTQCHTTNSNPCMLDIHISRQENLHPDKLPTASSLGCKWPVMVHHDLYKILHFLGHWFKMVLRGLYCEQQASSPHEGLEGIIALAHEGLEGISIGTWNTMPSWKFSRQSNLVAR